MCRPLPHVLNGLLRRVRQLEDDLARRNAGDGISGPSSAGSTCPEACTVEQERSSPCQSSPTFSSAALPSILGPSDDLRGIRSTDSHARPGSQWSLRHHLGQKWYSRGMDILSQAGRAWIHSKTGQDDVLESFMLFEPRSNASMALTQHSQSSCDSIGELPPESLIRKAADVLHRTSLTFPGLALDQSLVDDTLTKAYQSPIRTAFSYSQLSAKVYVWALYAVASLSKEARALSEAWRGYEYAEKAQSYLGGLTKESTLDNIQAILMIVRRSSHPGGVTAVTKFWHSKYIEGQLESFKPPTYCILLLVAWFVSSEHILIRL